MKSENIKIVVAKSRNGQGVFALQYLKSGEKISPVTGVCLRCDADDDTSEEVRANTYRFDEDTYVSPAGAIGDFFNHSCNPNAKIIKEKGNLYLVSISGITQGDEVVFDYSTITASDDVWEMKCNCGYVKCRRVAGRFVDLPDEIQKKYIRLQIVPQYILDISESA